MGGRPRPWRWQWLAVHEADDRIDTGGDAARKITGAKVWRDDVADDALGVGVGNRAFEAAPHFDPELVVILRDHDEHAVVDALAAELPGGENTVGVGLDLLWRRRRHDQDRDLAALLRLKGSELLLESRHRRGVERARLIGDPRHLGYGEKVLRDRRSRRNEQ